MTTKHSPLPKLQKQADEIARRLKSQGAQRAAATDGIEPLKVGIVMDDKLITLFITLAEIRDTSEEALAAYILKQMREEKENA